MITVAVVDDDERVCHYVRRILENAPDLVVAWHALSGTEAVQTLRGSTVDVLLLDVRMPSLDGVSALEAILAEARAPAVVVLTNYNDERVVMRALRAGAAGVLLKSVSPSDLIAAVRMAASGHRVLGVGVTAPWERSPVDPGPPETPAEAALTARERDVLALRATACRIGQSPSAWLYVRRPSRATFRP